MSRIFSTLIGVLLLAGVAQAATPTPVELELAGPMLDGQPFALSAQRGKVVLVMYWSTDCAVCRDKMAELRRNAQGWRGKPFELVLVNVDRRRSDWLDYERVLGIVVPDAARQPRLWRGDASYRDNLGSTPLSLPLSFVVDAAGRVAARYEGRMAPEAWDAIADLMP